MEKKNQDKKKKSKNVSTTKKGGEGREVKVVASMVAWDSIKAPVAQEFAHLISSGAVDQYGVICATLLPMARDIAVRGVWDKDNDWTHFWFLDQDMNNLTPETLHRLVSHDVDIIQPMVVRRRSPHAPAACPLKDNKSTVFIDAMDAEEPPLIECLHVGTGGCLIKREVFEKTGVMTPDGMSWFGMSKDLDPKLADRVNKLIEDTLSAEVDEEKVDEFIASAIGSAVDLGCDAYTEGRQLGEDVSFCRRARSKGFRCWCDTGCIMGHIGDYPYDIRHHIAYIRDDMEKKRKEKPVEYPPMLDNDY